MREMYVSMHIIGKIIEENLLSLLIQKRCVKTGTQKILLLLTKMDATWSTDVNLVTDGKNKNSILTFSR